MLLHGGIDFRGMSKFIILFSSNMQLKAHFITVLELGNMWVRIEVDTLDDRRNG